MTSTSIGHDALHFPHSMHFFPEGYFFMRAKRDGIFITRETGHRILQNARFLPKAKARITAEA
jgi:hypothetical protein